MASKRGLLILNLGTPDSPKPDDVGRYLKQFLMDKWVIDIPLAFRWFFVNVLIVPKRKFASSEAYEKIWTQRGSPLLFHLKDLARKVSRVREDLKVAYAMRYGSPSTESGLRELADMDEILVFPLYPQYAESSTRSSKEECERVARDLGLKAKLTFVKDYFEHPEFIESFAELIRPVLEKEKPDHLLMSFHGLPERHVKRTDPTGQHCLATKSCCDTITPANRDCYRAQSYATARALARTLGLHTDQYTVSFQSRLGRTPWIQPFTDVRLDELPKKENVKSLAVVCPSFAADCLETLEEIGIRAREQFKAAGGEAFTEIPCLNSSDRWAQAVGKIAKDHGF
jgi:protoporphyrin/coproporphyrin ferrochelatase